MNRYTDIVEVTWNAKGDPEVRGAGLPTLKLTSREINPFAEDLEIRSTIIKLYKEQGFDVRDAEFSIEDDEEK